MTTIHTRQLQQYTQGNYNNTENEGNKHWGPVLTEAHKRKTVDIHTKEEGGTKVEHLYSLTPILRTEYSTVYVNAQSVPHSKHLPLRL